MKDNQKDKLNNEDTNETLNTGNKVPNIRQVEGQDITNRDEKDATIGGLKPSMSEPRSGGRKGGTSVEDGGQDMGSSAGSR